MPTKCTVTLTTLGTSSVIVLPKPIVDGFNLGKGQRLELIVRDDGIYIPLTEQDPPAKADDQSEVT
jgi:bifunctional DNA-binding transcriptional regulator/antitoxin component of YhaV-PrlF toxin-antitoxin module